jgi:hypothetical protein
MFKARSFHRSIAGYKNLSHRNEKSGFGFQHEKPTEKLPSSMMWVGQPTGLGLLRNRESCSTSIGFNGARENFPSLRRIDLIFILKPILVSYNTNPSKNA